MQKDAGIKRLGDDVIAAERELFVAVGLADRIRNFFAGQLCQRVNGSQLHLLIDAGGVNVKSPTENKRKTEDVIDLIGVIGTAGCDNNVIADRLGDFRRNFRVRVGHGKDNRVGGHAGHHLGGKSSLDRQPVEHVGASDSFFQRPEIGFGRKECLVGIHSFNTTLVDDALGVAHDHVVRLDPEGDGQLCAGVG